MSASNDHIQSVAASYFGHDLAQKIIHDLEVVEVAGGDWLFQQGEPGNALFLAVRGRLQVLLTSEESDQPRLLTEVTPGDSVGEAGLITGEPRSAGVRAIRDSLLIKIDRQHFDNLAVKHPSLVMKLAVNVADMLQRKGLRKPARQPNALALVPLSDSAQVRHFISDLVEQIGQYSENLTLSSQTLLDQGAPNTIKQPSDGIPEELKNWLHDQETLHPLLIYSCDPNDGSWTQFATRQSDLILFIADAGDKPDLSEWQQNLQASRGTTSGKRALVLLQSGEEISGTSDWLERWQVDYHLHVRERQPHDIARVARIVSGNATGLVFSGGGARGFAHIGVYKALIELGVAIDWVGGASIGSIFASPIAADWDYDLAYEKAKQSFTKVKPFSDYTLPLVSLIRGKRMSRELEKHQSVYIEDLPIPYFCVSSVLDSGELQVHERGWLPSALRASASMPGVLPPAVIDQRLTIDGAVLNCMPVDIMKQKPVGKVIAVDLSSHKSYRVEYTAMPSPWAILAGRFLPFFKKHRVPSLMTTILKATEIGTLSQVRQSGEMADLLIQPPVRQFGLTEVKAFDHVVNIGYECAKEKLSTWLAEEEHTDGRKISR